MRHRLRDLVVLFLGISLFAIPGVAIGADINFGVSGPMTGPAANFGLDCLHGAEIFAKEINDAGGITIAGTLYKIKVHGYDDEGNAAKAVAGMQKLRDRYDVRVISQNQSACIMGMLQKNEDLGVLLIGFYRHPNATEIGNKLVLRQQDKMTDEARKLVAGVVKYVKPKTYATLSDVGDFGKSFTSVFEEAFKEHGVEEVAREWLDMRTQVDFRGQLTNIKRAAPDVLMITAYDEASAAAVKQAKEIGLKTEICLSSAFTQKGEALTGPELIEGCLKPLLFYDRTNPVPPAVKRYKTELYPAMNYDDPCGVYGMSVYQQFHTILKAMQKAGTTTDMIKVRQAAIEVVPIEEKYNTCGLLKWFEDGNGLMDHRLGIYRNGRIEMVDLN